MTTWTIFDRAALRQPTRAERRNGLAPAGIGRRVAHDPGDPLITSHCPFCGSGQVVGRSDGTISCDFCGQNYIVRVQPAFPGMPQMPGGPGAPSDIGPDGGMLPPDAIGPDGLPAGGGMDPGMEDGGGAPPSGDDEGEAGPPDDGDGPPPPGAGSDDSGSKGGKSDKKPKSKKESAYRGFEGQALTEDQYIRHLAATLSGGHPAVMAALRADTARRGRRPFARSAALREDTPENRGHYQRGWRAAANPVETEDGSPLERADIRGEHPAWYDGYMDLATDRPKWHSLRCPSRGDHDAPGCSLYSQAALEREAAVGPQEHGTGSTYDDWPDMHEPDSMDYEYHRPARIPDSYHADEWRQIHPRDQLHRNVTLRHQLSQVFPVVGRDHVAAETGHTLSELTDAGGNTSVYISHPNMAPYDTIKLHLGGPDSRAGEHFPELMRRMHTPAVVRSMREQMAGREQSEPIHEDGVPY